MIAKRVLLPVLFGVVAMFVAITISADAGDKKAEKKAPNKVVWTDPADSTLPIDFKFQGEYVDNAGGGCQVIALGQGAFQAVIYQGGLPGKGGAGKGRVLLHGNLEGEKVVLSSIDPTEKRKYLAQSPLEFSAAAKFPPEGHLGGYSGVIAGDTLTIQAGDGKGDMKKIVRKSSSLGKKPPEGAVVLFDGANKDEWNGGRVDKATSLLNTDGADITTKRKFSSYTVHVEFMLPYRPDARGQGRGNSGFYQVDHYEVQILDSFGLDGKDNECGGIYSRIAPKLNMCLPPLQWQTYDIEFTNAVRENDKVVKKSRITARLNGELIHDNIEISGVTGGARSEPEGTPGVLRLQGHGNPLQFKNIWIVEKK